MPVKPNSRYAALPLQQVTTPDGTTRRVIQLRLERQTPTQTVQHQVMQGETLDLLARQYYGDERLWWRIADANPLIYPFDIKAGDVLDVPVVGEAARVNRTRRF